MRTLTEQARSLVALLRDKPPFFNLMRKPDTWNREIIERLGNCGEPAAIPYLLPALTSGDRKVILEAARAIKRLVSELPGADLPWLDHWMRDPYSGDDFWYRLEPRELLKWVGPGEPGVLLIQLASMHFNGYVREAAVRQLRLVVDGSELPYLLLRVNDWVSNVREIAKAAILDCIHASYATFFVRDLALVVRLEETRRDDHAMIITAIAELLRDPEVRASMIDAMHCPVRAIRRVSFRILSSVEALELPEVLAEAMASRDSIVRLRAARVALNHFRNEELRAKASELLRDRSAAIRLEALRTIASSFPGAIDKALQSAVLDSNAAIRNEARFLLGKIEKQDFLTMYREALTNPRTPILLAAIAGISETGTSADAKLLLPLLSHPLPRIRKTAVKFFAKLGGDDSIEQVIERLLDRSPGVSKQASQALARISAPIDATSLWRLFCESNIVHVRRNVLPLLAALPKWESITYLLLASNDDDEVIAKQARDQVLRWHSMFNRYQALPTLTQLTRLEEALLQARDLLPPHVSDLIRFSVNDLRGVLTRNQS